MNLVYIDVLLNNKHFFKMILLAVSFAIFFMKAIYNEKKIHK